ncbi:MAG: 4-hydroxy-tetrahydrodipicolinate synthase [Clostridia bacterium]|nr:4-hydroxy-tetrahydrodipicolinate synthase [Clostridia bacterium]
MEDLKKEVLFEGVGTALVTPMNSDYSINYDKFEELIINQIKEGVQAIIVIGTTGESSTLSLDEKKQLIKRAVSASKGKVKIIVGTGSNNTESAIYLSKYAEEAGADGLLIVTPYYNKCNQDGLYEHYSKIADSVSIPILLYNVPSRTSVSINPETVIKLSKIKNIVGIKEASTDLVEVAKIIAGTDESFSVYSGNDNLTLPILALGGKGVISVTSNILPKEMVFLCNSYFNSNLTKARQTNEKLLDIMNDLFIDVNPIPIKEAMNTLGYNVGPVRLPLSKMSTEKYIKLNDTMQKYDLKLF